jgi:hypothetical protein
VSTRDAPPPHLDETAAVLGVSPRTARRIVATGALPCFRHGPRIVRVRDVDLAAFVARGVTAANPRSATGRPAA